MEIGRYKKHEELAAGEIEAVREVLTRARSQIERGWTRFVAAKDENGRSVGDCPESVEILLQRAKAILAPESRNETLYAYNDADGRTQGEVVALFNKAIELTNEIKKEGTDAPETSD